MLRLSPPRWDEQSIRLFRMEVFDLLPPFVRAAINFAAFPHDPLIVEQVMREQRLSDVEMARRIIAADARLVAKATNHV